MTSLKTLAFIAAIAMMQCAAVYASPIVANGDFETGANLFTSYPGYVGGSNPSQVTDFVPNTGGGYGINAGNGAGAPFRDNGNDQTNVLFIQAGGTVLTQAISGFTPGSSYELDFDYNARACCGGTAGINVSLGAGTTGNLVDNPVEAGNSFTLPLHHGSFVFVAGNSGTETLTISKYDAVAGDSTATFDNFVITAVPEPASVVLLGLGAIGLAIAARRRKA